MAFDGYLMKFGSDALPTSLLTVSSYKITPDQRTEMDAWRDSNNLLHRVTAVNHKTKIEFNTKPLLTIAEKQTLFNVISRGLLDARQRKYSLTYWDTETDVYKTGTFYMPDTDYTVSDVRNGVIIYDSLRLAFIEY